MSRELERTEAIAKSCIVIAVFISLVFLIGSLFLGLSWNTWIWFSVFCLSASFLLFLIPAYLECRIKTTCALCGKKLGLLSKKKWKEMKVCFNCLLISQIKEAWLDTCPICMAEGKLGMHGLAEFKCGECNSKWLIDIPLMRPMEVTSVWLRDLSYTYASPFPKNRKTPLESWRLEILRTKEEKRLQKEREEAIEKFEKEQIAMGRVKFVDGSGREIWGTVEQVKEWKITDMDMRNNFERLTPRQFETLVKELFVKMGYDARLTSRTADYGADVIAKKHMDTVVVQVKKFSPPHKVSNRDVQRLLGSMWKYDANKAIFVTTSGYTDFAQKQATKAPIELWNKEKLCEMIEKYLLEADSHISPFIESSPPSWEWKETKKD